MPIYLGSTERTKIYLGGTEIQKVYLGSSLVYSSSSEVVFPTGTTTETTLKSDMTNKIVTFNSDGSLTYSSGLTTTLSPNGWVVPPQTGIGNNYYIRLNVLALTGITTSRTIVTNCTLPDPVTQANWDSLSTPRYFGLRATSVNQLGTTYATVGYSIARLNGLIYEVLGSESFVIQVSYANTLP